MRVRLCSGFPEPTQKQPLTEADYVRLKQQLCVARGRIGLREEDLEVLRAGEAAFLWESPLAASAEEAEAMARQAASDMVPAFGWVTRAVVLHILANSEYSLDTIQTIAGTIQQAFSENAAIIFSAGLTDEKGIRFLAAAAEGRTEEGGKRG